MDPGHREWAVATVSDLRTFVCPTGSLTMNIKLLKPLILVEAIFQSNEVLRTKFYSQLQYDACTFAARYPLSHLEG